MLIIILIPTFLLEWFVFGGNNISQLHPQPLNELPIQLPLIDNHSRRPQESNSFLTCHVYCNFVYNFPCIEMIIGLVVTCLGLHGVSERSLKSNKPIQGKSKLSEIGTSVLASNIDLIILAFLSGDGLLCFSFHLIICFTAEGMIINFVLYQAIMSHESHSMTIKEVSVDMPTPTSTNVHLVLGKLLLNYSQ